MLFHLIPMTTVIVAAVAAVAPAVALPAQGDRATYVFGGLPRCVLVTYVDTGPDQRRWVWIVGGHSPQWALHVPADEMAPGCADDIGK